MTDKLDKAAKVLAVAATGVGIVALIWSMFRKPAQINPPPGPGPVYYYPAVPSLVATYPQSPPYPYAMVAGQEARQPCPCGQHPYHVG